MIRSITTTQLLRTTFASCITVTVVILPTSCGCVTTGGIAEGLALHHELRAQRHQDKRDELRARADEQRAAQEAAHAACELKEQAAQRNQIDALRARLAFTLDQRFVMSELEVDADELKQLMAKRDKDYEELKRLWDKIERQMEAARSDQEVAEARQRLDALARRGAAKGCCVPCPVSPCEQPARLPELPAKRPITPVEIPMVMRVRWRVGMESPRIEEARVHQLPSLPAKRPCANCPTCAQHGCDCRHHAQSTKPSPDSHFRPRYPTSNHNDTPPVPPPDETAQSVTAGHVRPITYVDLPWQ